MPVLRDLDQQRAEPPDLLGREAGRRLVEQQEGGAQHQGARDLDEAQLAVLQPVGAHGGELFEADRGEREHRGLAQHRFVARVARQRQQRLDERARAVDGAADHHVLQHRGLADDARGLERARDAHARARVVRELRQHRAVELRACRAAARSSRRSRSASWSCRCRSGRSARAPAPGRIVEVEPVDRAHAAEAQRHLFERQRAGIARPAPSRRASRSGRGTIARLLCERAAVLEIEQVGDAARASPARSTSSSTA